MSFFQELFSVAAENHAIFSLSNKNEKIISFLIYWQYKIHMLMSDLVNLNVFKKLICK